MQRFALALVLAMSTTAGTTLAGEADKAPAPEDRYLWLEEVTGDKPLDWARARNAESAKVLGTPEEAALEKRILDILDSKERIPTVEKLGPWYYNLWKDAKMGLPQRQISNYLVDDALAEMGSAGVDWAVIHPPGTHGGPANALEVEAARAHPEKYCILGNFDPKSPDRESIVARWRERPGMLGFRFTLSQGEQKSWWTDGTLDWFWPACEKAGLVLGLLATGLV